MQAACSFTNIYPSSRSPYRNNIQTISNAVAEGRKFSVVQFNGFRHLFKNKNDLLAICALGCHSHETVYANAYLEVLNPLRLFSNLYYHAKTRHDDKPYAQYISISKKATEFILTVVDEASSRIKPSLSLDVRASGSRGCSSSTKIEPSPVCFPVSATPDPPTCGGSDMSYTWDDADVKMEDLICISSDDGDEGSTPSLSPKTSPSPSQGTKTVYEVLSSCSEESLVDTTESPKKTEGR